MKEQNVPFETIWQAAQARDMLLRAAQIMREDRRVLALKLCTAAVCLCGTLLAPLSAAHAVWQCLPL